MAREKIETGHQVDAAFAAEIDTWRGNRRVRLRLQRLLPASAPTSAPTSAIEET
jgi:hypothetical protein